MNQCSTILNHLMSKGKISSSMARSKYGIQKLSARIKDLRLMGVNIDCNNGEYILRRMKHKHKIKETFEDDLFPDYNG